MAPLVSHEANMARNVIHLTPIRYTPQEWADLNALVLTRKQMIERGLLVDKFSTDELAKLRRCLFCRRRIFQQRRKVLHDGDGNAIEYDESDDELSKLRQRHITKMEIAFRMRLAEDLEWALLVRQRLVFLEDTDEGKEGAHRTNEEFPVEPATSVAKYYSCPSYVLLDPECVFDYSNFTSLAADEPIYHRPGPDGRTRHFQGRLQLRIETGDAGWIHAEVIEAEFQEYLRNQVYRQEDIIREGHCEGHPGEFRKGNFTCCNQGPFSRGCSQSPHHVNNQTLWQVWKDFELHETPKGCKSPRRCVVLDCEMGVANTGDPELIRIAAVDYFSGETLLDSLVFPQLKMWHLNTRFSGVTWPMLYKAREAGRTIPGRDAARRRLWSFVGKNTVVIVHGGYHDFLALRWIHRNVIDTLDCEHRRAVPERSPGLKNLANIHLGREIQRGRKGHDSVEDAQTTRDLASWYVKNLPPEAKVKPESR